MTDDIIRDLGYLCLGSRLKRLGERLQGDVTRVVEATGLPIQPSQYPILAAIDRHGPLTVGEIVQAMGVSQPSVTRNLSRLAELGLVDSDRKHRDQRHKTFALTEAGREALVLSKQSVWPQVEAAVFELCGGLSGSLLDQLGALEDGLADMSLSARVSSGAAAGLKVIGYSDDLAGAFHDINAEWIGQMFTLEQTDRDVLEAPRERIIEPGGDILFVTAEGLGVVGTCALQKTGEGQFELTKMGVREAARGRKAGEFLLHAMVRRAAELGAETLYLLTNSKCGPAIHLYEKLGFEHDEAIMRNFGARYERCNVAMRHRPHA